MCWKGQTLSKPLVLLERRWKTFCLALSWCGAKVYAEFLLLALLLFSVFFKQPSVADEEAQTVFGLKLVVIIKIPSFLEEAKVFHGQYSG